MSTIHARVRQGPVEHPLLISPAARHVDTPAGSGCAETRHPSSPRPGGSSRSRAGAGLHACDYETLLVRMWGFYHAVEGGLAECVTWGQLGLDPAERWKVSLLERDLAGLAKPRMPWRRFRFVPILSRARSVPARARLHVRAGRRHAWVGHHCDGTLAVTWKIGSAFSGAMAARPGQCGRSSDGRWPATWRAHPDPA
jgi:hypothetical protein